MALSDKLELLARVDRHIEPAEVIADWVKAVNSLYGFVLNAIDTYVQQKLLRLESVGVARSEETLGTYHISQLHIHAGPETIIFNPVGRFVPRAIGRVDVYRQGYVKDAETLLRVEGPLEPPWLMHGPPPPGANPLAGRLRDVPLTREALDALLDRLLPG